MFRFSAKSMIISGGVMLVLSILLSALLVVEVLPKSFGLNSLAYIFLVGGVFVGMMGIFSYAKISREKYAMEEQEQRLRKGNDEP